MERDFLDEIVANRTRNNARFPELVDDAGHRRALAKALAKRREVNGLTQTVVAAKMGTAASVVSKLEAGGDVKLSTFQRYCAAIGQPLQLALKQPAARPGATSRKRRRAQTAVETRRALP